MGKVAVNKNDTLIGKNTYTITIFPKTDVEFYGLDVYTHTTTVHCRCDMETVSITKPLANVEVEIQ
ncbi:hypothetical protein DW701_10330 [Bacteroides eggerthii]|uniref:Uncharacterized protein n=1 Tax=Bacteroides eggerthii TaxID=28111 RepID=A0A414MCG3_9BACE|nr:hypothetical protein DW701_10330 [Bacteroides eggerthii]RHH23580.1 hypothetical protein DW218_06215 [Bacteroides eggerthii]